MLAVDTNILVRLLTEDDPRQTPKARRLFDEEAIFLTKTVLLETAWVLEELYHLKRSSVLQALSRVVGLANVATEDERSVYQALDWALDGMDFPDAMHLASSRSAERFVTFDRALIKAARRAGATPPAVAP